MKNLYKCLLILTSVLFSANAMAYEPQAADFLQNAGTYQGHGFNVDFTAKFTAQLAWDDGYQGFFATYNSRPDPAVRCPCDVYESTGWEGDRQVVRRVIASYDATPGREYTRVEFQKIDLGSGDLAVGGACAYYAGNQPDQALGRIDCKDDVNADECGLDKAEEIFGYSSRAMYQGVRHFAGVQCNSSAVLMSIPFE